MTETHHKEWETGITSRINVYHNSQYYKFFDSVTDVEDIPIRLKIIFPFVELSSH